MVKLCFCDAMHVDCGILVDCAYDTTRIVPFDQGHIIEDCVKTNQIGGKHITKSIFCRIANKNRCKLTQSKYGGC